MSDFSETEAEAEARLYKSRRLYREHMASQQKELLGNAAYQQFLAAHPDFYEKEKEASEYLQNQCHDLKCYAPLFCQNILEQKSEHTLEERKGLYAACLKEKAKAIDAKQATAFFCAEQDASRVFSGLSPIKCPLTPWTKTNYPHYEALKTKTPEAKRRETFQLLQAKTRQLLEQQPFREKRGLPPRVKTKKRNTLQHDLRRYQDLAWSNLKRNLQEPRNDFVLEETEDFLRLFSEIEKAKSDRQRLRTIEVHPPPTQCVLHNGKCSSSCVLKRQGFLRPTNTCIPLPRKRQKLMSQQLLKRQSPFVCAHGGEGTQFCKDMFQEVTKRMAPYPPSTILSPYHLVSFHR